MFSYLDLNLSNTRKTSISFIFLFNLKKSCFFPQIQRFLPLHKKTVADADTGLTKTHWTSLALGRLLYHARSRLPLLQPETASLVLSLVFVTKSKQQNKPFFKEEEEEEEKKNRTKQKRKRNKKEKKSNVPIQCTHTWVACCFAQIFSSYKYRKGMELVFK